MKFRRINFNLSYIIQSSYVYLFVFYTSILSCNRVTIKLLVDISELIDDDRNINLFGARIIDFCLLINKITIQNDTHIVSSTNDSEIIIN